MTIEKRMEQIMKTVEMYKEGHISRKAAYMLIEHHLVSVNKEKMKKGDLRLVTICLA